ncbi:hypothetical protein ACFFJB_02555 [Camelimonas abortus]|uniref:Uncharacterized protein n=1 Tax=Camelimonas abortus TaxID=1017184 RepID=A0ABV7LI24_9HYPH
MFWKKRGRIIMDGEQARAGSWGVRALYVLLASLALASAAWLVLEIWGGGPPRIQ